MTLPDMLTINTLLAAYRAGSLRPTTAVEAELVRVAEYAPSLIYI